jgi:hypothetical protein
MLVFRDVTPCGLLRSTNVSENQNASIFRSNDGDGSSTDTLVSTYKPARRYNPQTKIYRIIIGYCDGKKLHKVITGQSGKFEKIPSLAT